jgi:hypothetical protein
LNNSKVLNDIIRSVSDSLLELGWVLYLLIITMVIYASFGLEFFEVDTDNGPAGIGCHSVVSCFILYTYKGVPGQGIDGTVLNTVMRNSLPTGHYLARMAFDLSFFIWVVQILFNIITGLLVDGFGALRDEANERRDILENSCFVCGYTRAQYDDIPNFHGAHFDFHRDTTHHYWLYVYYFIYLRNKDQEEFSGVESYVWSELEKDSLAWIPVKGSAAIQAARAFVEDEEREPVDGRVVDGIHAQVHTMQHTLAALKKQLTEKSAGGGASGGGGEDGGQSGGRN